ncbi:unnamed protein product [Cyclocybe aegerita]|uniref:Peroxidase n=1 Tax=Cyclocybe aegerita TaxID=1973307 RepID=A0A8S0WEC7_CYCAE|nr:unnamed protein product [Cyclocybe aegerita]
MIKQSLYGIVILALAYPALSAKWPNHERDEPENFVYEGRREHPGGFIKDFYGLLANCVPDANAGGSSIAAQWVRFAYHDMSTHNIDEGIGGLDGSIRYELDRDENIGLNFTLRSFVGHANRYLSFPDIIAVGVIGAIATCGGPLIPFRSGRAFSGQAGPFGVPAPDQDLADHLEIFRRQGFNQEEMIGLVACGHTLGGVRNRDFPYLVPPNPDPSVPNIQNFAPTPKFDNGIAKEYLAQTTNDVLVIGVNETTRSDLRIFSSDGNEMMEVLAHDGTFSNTCRHLLERMINTVPSGVALSDVVELLPVKVGPTFLGIADGLANAYDRLTLRTDIRLLDPNPNRIVTLYWSDCFGGDTIYAAQPYNISDASSAITKALGHSPVRYWFAAPVDIPASVSKFWFSVDEGNGEPPTICDNDGEGHVIKQDEVLLAPTLSWVDSESSNTTQIVIGVKGDSTSSQIYGKAHDPEGDNGSALEIDISFTLDESIQSVGGYSFYRSSTISSLSFSFDISTVVDGRTYTEEFLRSFFITKSSDS